eukprot:jgi/Chlat1/4728/Chrsp30S04763
MPLGKRGGDGDSRYAGVVVAEGGGVNAAEALRAASAGGFDYIVLPLAHQKRDEATPVLVGSDLLLNSTQWTSRRASTWIDLDSPDQVVQRDSEAALRQELSWATYLSLQACLLPTPRALNCANYARCVNQLMATVHNMQLWLQIPLVDDAMLAAEDSGKEDELFLEREAVSRRPLHDTWEWWNMFRSLCEHNSLLSPLLFITPSLPSQASLQRWIGESVKAAILPTTVFLTNKRGFPTLSRRHQDLVNTLFEHNVQIIIQGEPLHAPPDDSSSAGTSDAHQNGSDLFRHPLRFYLDYVSYLYRKQPPMTEQEKFEVTYRDYLQAPLQPLMDNLEFQTYETFEKDATKYSQYRSAVRACLLDRVTEEEASSRTSVIMVVGAGRGPLVRASLQAAEEAGRKVKVYAVEKNPNAVITIHGLIAAEGWQELVTVVGCDMRAWNPPELADILVSELLGSFGDNELSPECLDGAQRLLKEDGVSIPSSYTSFLAPITAAKLYNDVKAYNDLAHFETAYVVKLHNCDILSDPQPVFTFEHPNRAKVIDNTRYKKLTFSIQPDVGSATLHGFSGYFDAVLYKDIHLGIEPSTHTPDMFSWFAIYFPMRIPVYIPAGRQVEVHFWRCVSSSKVWYEWSLTAPEVSPIHNPSGRSYFVGL